MNELLERLNRLVVLQAKYPFSNAISEEIDNIVEKIREKKDGRDNEQL